MRHRSPRNSGFVKGCNFCDILFASLGNKTLPERHLLLTFFFSVLTPAKKGGKKMKSYFL